MNVFSIIITTSKRMESAVCRRNLFRGRKEIKGKEKWSARERLARLLKNFRDDERRGDEGGWRGGGAGGRNGENGEKERPAGTGSGENPDGKALSSRSRVHSLPSLDFPSLLPLTLLFPFYPPCTSVRFGLVGNILTISFSSRYTPASLRSKNYTSRLCSRGAPGATHKLPLLSLATLNRRGNKIFLLTRHRAEGEGRRARERHGASISARYPPGRMCFLGNKSTTIKRAFSSHDETLIRRRVFGRRLPGASPSVAAKSERESGFAITIFIVRQTTVEGRGGLIGTAEFSHISRIPLNTSDRT